MIHGLELPTLYVYTGTGLVDTGISTKSTSYAIEYIDSDKMAGILATYHNDLVVPNIPLGDKVPCNVTNSASQLRCILDVQISSLKNNEETGGYDIINRNVSLVQGESYTFVYSDAGVRGNAKIVKGKIKSITSHHVKDKFSDEYFIEVDASKSNESNIVEIRDIFLYDVQDIDYEYNEDEFAAFIDRIRKSGENPYTTAYLINSQAAPGKPRDYCYTRLVMPKLHAAIPELISKVKKAERPEDIITYLKGLPAVADFIAHEFYQDFTYIPRYTDREFMKFDQNDFTNVGPGASIGIRLIYPSLKTAREQKQAIYWLRDLADEWLTKIGEEKGEPMVYLNWDKFKSSYFLTEECNITLHQIEMWLCEFQKYWKMIIGEGKQRSKFVPKTQKLIVES